MSEIAINEAKSDAMRWRADARNRVGEPAPTPEALAQERLAALAASCPAAGVAAAVVAVNGWPVVPLDPDTLDPSAAPLDTAVSLFAHLTPEAGPVASPTESQAIAGSIAGEDDVFHGLGGIVGGWCGAVVVPDRRYPGVHGVHPVAGG